MLRKEDFEPNMKTEDKIPGAQSENPAYADCKGHHGTFSGDIFSGNQ